jgi:hypothetical protein
MRFAPNCFTLPLLAAAILCATSARASAAERPIDEAKVREAGIRRLESRRLLLYTDLPSSPDVDELPQVFDQAVDQWCAYFGIKPDRLQNWRMRASIMHDAEKFTSVGLLPADLPKFLNGYTRRFDCWLYNQTSPYYRRHLLLHEGVHGFMWTLLGKNAPPWYMEGMAELLATHHWADGKLELPYFPRTSAETLKLNRIEIVQSDVAHKRGKQLIDVAALNDFLQTEPYAWSWAATAFLDGHPRYRDRFQSLSKQLSDDDNFNAKSREAFAADGAELAEEWQVFTNEIDYGYDFNRTAIDFTPGKPLNAKPQTVHVEADHGWQNSGIKLEAGKTYSISATGQYQVANRAKPWISEPNGISIRYFNDRPLGLLLAAIRPEKSTGASQFTKPIVTGNGTTIKPEQSGTLYFKINDSPGELGDNSGQATVTIAPN